MMPQGIMESIHQLCVFLLQQQNKIITYKNVPQNFNQSFFFSILLLVLLTHMPLVKTEVNKKKSYSTMDH